MREEWKVISDYPIYEVSTLGNIRNSFTFRLLKPSINAQGYLYVGLSKNKTSKRVNIHRIVAQTFLENPNNLPFVDHIDINKQNNYVTNLRWISYQNSSINIPKHKDSTSEFKGVSWQKNNQKWCVHICKNYIVYSLGYYENSEIAAAIYNVISVRIFKEFTHLNKINKNLYLLPIIREKVIHLINKFKF